MNCRQGDLAVIVYMGTPRLKKFIGRIVECKEFFHALDGSPSWEMVEPVVNGAEVLNCIKDKCLRPIRDQPGADETLTWAAVPTLTPEAVPA